MPMEEKFLLESAVTTVNLTIVVDATFRSKNLVCIKKKKKREIIVELKEKKKGTF